MASLESTWDLKSNSILKCFSVSVIQQGQASQEALSSTNNRPFITSTGTTGIVNSNTNVNANTRNNNSQSLHSTNPFDPIDMTISSSSSSSALALRSSSNSNKNVNNAMYAVVFGTEAGYIHYRTFPYLTNNIDTSRDVSRSDRDRKQQSQGGYSNTFTTTYNTSYYGNRNINNQAPNTNTNPYTSTYSNTSTNTYNEPSSVNYNLINNHKPFDYNLNKSNNTNNNTITSNLSTLACIRASSTHDYDSSMNNTINPLFLILQQDSSSTSSVTTNISSQSSTSSSNTNSNNNSGAYSASLISIHPSTGTVSTLLGNTTTTNNNNTLLPLPKMSHVTYHPNTGFLYSNGNTVQSLPSDVVRLISSHLSPSSSLQPQQKSTQLPTIYYNAMNITSAPTPIIGTTRSGNKDSSMVAVCNGHVVIIAIGTIFYAVGGIPISEKFWNPNHNSHDSQQQQPQPQHSIEKVISFAQSSLVHPSIVVEIPTLSSSNSTTTNSPKIHSSEIIKDDQSSITSLVFLASGRECAVVEIFLHRGMIMMTSSSSSVSTTNGAGSMVIGSPRHGIATLPSPILAAVGLPIPYSSTSTSLSLQSSRSTSSSIFSNTIPLVAVLTSDGLVHTRSPSCIAIPLSTIEVGNRPNDFFTVRAIYPPFLTPMNTSQQQQQQERLIVAASYSGEGRVISFAPDTIQDLVDRLIKLSIDAFGTNGFPRSELADALNASYTATSYVGPEPNESARNILRQYLEATLGLDPSGDSYGSLDLSSWIVQDSNSMSKDDMSTSDSSKPISTHRNHRPPPHRSVASPLTAIYSCSTALLCLVCTHFSPPHSSLANRAAKACGTKLGVVSNYHQSGMNAASVKVCEIIADRLLKEASSKSNVNLLNAPAPSPIRPSSHHGRSKSGMLMDMLEAAIWLLRSCGQHERSLQALQDHMNNPNLRNQSISGKMHTSTPPHDGVGSGGWSQLKYESHIATHLSDLWSCGDEACRHLVLRSSATQQLLENNPQLGLRIFTAPHPQNEQQWDSMLAKDDPLASFMFPTKVVELLKSIRPIIPFDNRLNHKNESSVSSDIKSGIADLPLESGRALTVTFLESVIGLSTGKPPVPFEGAFSYIPEDETNRNRIADLHDELAYLLLEGVVSERTDDDSDDDSSIVGKRYRGKLRRFLSWSNSKIRSEKLISSLPASFLHEKALLLGRLGRHEDAIRIFYFDLKSLDLALEYCDACHERNQLILNHEKRLSRADSRRVDSDKRSSKSSSCVYLPLVSVALESSRDTERGIAAAIQILSLRRDSIDRSAALRLLPKSIPVSSIAQPFLIPALIDSESQVRRLMIVASLLRSKYVGLKHSLTAAQIKSNSNIHSVPALQSLQLGDPLYSSKPFKARPANIAISHFPDVTVIKHFFPRYVVLQAMVTNSAPALDGRTLGDVLLCCIESSHEALLPSVNVPIKILPPKITGCSWCVLAASPQRLDENAILTCELRYTILAVDSVTGTPLGFSSGFNVGTGRTFVEEVQNIEIRPAEFP